MEPSRSQTDIFPLTRPARVLFAMGDEAMRQFIAHNLEKEPIDYPFDTVATLPEARNWLEHYTPICIIMTATVALGDIVNSNGLIADLPQQTPTVSLIQRTREFPNYPDYLYISGAFHDYCMIPFSWEELRARVQFIVDRANVHRR